jgi:hypothetical protein
MAFVPPQFKDNGNLINIKSDDDDDSIPSQPPKRTYEAVPKGKHPPFSNLAVFVASATLSLFGGGMLYALNWKRLGSIPLFVLTLVVVYVALPIAFVTWLLSSNEIPDIRIGTLMGGQALIALICRIPQNPRLNKWREQYGEVYASSRATLGWGFAGLAIPFMMIFIPATAFNLIDADILGYSDYRDSAMSLTYPSRMRASDLPNCQNDISKCVLDLYTTDGNLSLQVTYYDNSEYTLLDISEGIWASIEESVNTPRLINRLDVNLNGFAGVKRDFTFYYSGELTNGRQLTVAHNEAIIDVLLVYTDEAREAMEKIFESIVFTRSQ